MFPVPLACRNVTIVDGPADETLKPKSCVTINIYLIPKAFSAEIKCKCCISPIMLTSLNMYIDRRMSGVFVVVD